MSKYLSLYLVFAATAFGFGGASAGEFGTPDEAKAMLQRAIEAVASDSSAAIEKFNRNDAQFRDRDLFVFCFKADDGRFTAHEAMIGWNIRTLRDAAGEPFGEEIFRSANDEQVVEVEFLSPIPGSTEMAKKRAFVVRIGDQVCGVSAYQLK